MRLADGRVLDADLVLAALGAAPNVGWLRNSEIGLGRGILTNEHCETTAPHVYAVGDVAESYSPRLGRRVVVEHWMNAREQAARAASRILGKETAQPAWTDLPYFWSDQLGVRIQALGYPDPAAETFELQWQDPAPGSLLLYGAPEQTDRRSWLQSRRAPHAAAPPARATGDTRGDRGVPRNGVRPQEDGKPCAPSAAGPSVPSTGT